MMNYLDIFMQRSLKTLFLVEYKCRVSQMEGVPLGLSKHPKEGMDKVLPACTSITELFSTVNLFNLDYKMLMKLPREPLSYLAEPVIKLIEPPSLGVSMVCSGVNKPSTAPKPLGQQREMVEMSHWSLKRDVHGQVIISKFNSQSSFSGAHSRSDDSMHGEKHFCHVTPRHSSKSRLPLQSSSRSGRNHTQLHHKCKWSQWKLMPASTIHKLYKAAIWNAAAIAKLSLGMEKDPTAKKCSCSFRRGTYIFNINLCLFVL